MVTIVFGLFLAVHGLIHLLGVAKAFHLAELPQLTQPISPTLGVLWLVAAVLFMSAAVSLAAWPRGWWLLAAVAVVISMMAIVPSWVDAWAGAIANGVIVVGVIVGFLVQGPYGLQAAYESAIDRILAAHPAATPVEATELMHLPPPVARYLQVSGVVGRPRVTNARVRMHGRIRSGPDARWMPFRAEQHNVFVGDRERHFFMSGTMRGVPFRGLHQYAGSAASMLVKAAGAVTVADAKGDDMTRAETVTLFNDMCVMAPATLLDPSIAWESLDDRVVRATFTNAGYSIRADLRFNDAGELTNFWSDDRLASADGGTMKAMRWSTPLSAYKSFDGVRIASRGEGRWHAPEGDYAYIELEIDAVAYNVHRRSR